VRTEDQRTVGGHGKSVLPFVLCGGINLFSKAERSIEKPFGNLICLIVVQRVEAFGFKKRLKWRDTKQ
jgi:hypothetical protein